MALASWHVTGLGVMMTTFHLMDIIHRYNPSRLLFAGIAGTFDENIAVGDVVQVRNEILVDFGAEEADGKPIPFLDIVPSISRDKNPWTAGELINPFPAISNIKIAQGITVPFASGASTTVEKRKQFNRQIESMENAAIFYCCLLKNIRFHVLRGISNRVEIRNRSAWDIPGACTALARNIEDIAFPIEGE